MRRFVGIRPNPPQEYINKGITNGPEKPDYEGVVFSDNSVVVHWLTKDYHSKSYFKAYEDFYDIHGHPEYGTVIEWIDS
jgi:hypothetical protein